MQAVVSEVRLAERNGNAADTGPSSAESVRRKSCRHGRCLSFVAAMKTSVIVSLGQAEYASFHQLAYAPPPPPPAGGGGGCPCTIS